MKVVKILDRCRAHGVGLPTVAAIVSSGVYLPRYRLDRKAAGIGRGQRSIASFDEDSTSMGVEAARRALGEQDRLGISDLLFCTTSPAYADRTNATAIHQALCLEPDVAAYDVGGSVRSTIAAVRAAADAADAGRKSLVVASDIRVGLPGSSDECNGGDGAVAVLLAPGPGLCELVSSGAATHEFLDRWRVPGELTSRVWEERFGETEYLPLADRALSDGLKRAGITIDDAHHVIVTGAHSRAVTGVRRAIGARGEAVVDLASTVGFCGTAHPLLLLVEVLDRAQPGELIVLVTLADGADCFVLRAGDGLDRDRAKSAVASQLSGRPVNYDDMLVWRGLLRREPPRRPDPDRPAAPPSSRNATWKYGLVGSRCIDCGRRHLPPERVCFACQSVDHMAEEPLADVLGTITTFSVDHLAFSVAPPVVVAVVDLDGGGRIQCELADVAPDEVAVGDRVEMTFRRMYTTADGVHNYFWKARLVREALA